MTIVPFMPFYFHHSFYCNYISLFFPIIGKGQKGKKEKNEKEEKRGWESPERQMWRESGRHRQYRQKSKVSTSNYKWKCGNNSMHPAF